MAGWLNGNHTGVIGQVPPGRLFRCNCKLCNEMHVLKPLQRSTQSPFRQVSLLLEGYTQWRYRLLELFIASKLRGGDAPEPWPASD